MSSDPVARRLIGGVLLSLLMHALVLSLQFGVPGLGLPGVELPWKERRVTLPPLTIQLAVTPLATSPAVASALPPPSPILAPLIPVVKPAPAPVAATGLSVFAPVKIDKFIPVAKKMISSKQQATPVPATRLARPTVAPVTPAEMPTPVIAQDQMRDDNFVMPLPSPEEPEHAVSEAAEPKKKAELMPAETTDQTALSEIEMAKSADLAIAKEQARQSADELAAKLAAKLVAKLAQEQAEKQRALQAEQQKKRQQEVLLATQVLENQLSAKKQEEQRRERLLAQELETRTQAEAQERQQAVVRQKQWEEQLAKQKAEELAARQKLEEMNIRQKAAEAVARIAAEQKLVEQKLVEQKLAEQKLAEQRERALADSQLAGKANAAGASAIKANNTGTSGGDFVLPKNMFSSDLANRSRDQSKGWDVLSGTPPVPRQSASDQTSRRRSVLGNFDKEVPLRMYVESWRQKIERNGNFNYSQSSKDKARGDPVVIVAIRSDGSVEDITIVRSSGQVDLDEAVTRIIRVNAPYAVFPQNIAAKYDVIEIRRVWRFDETLRIVEEIR